MSVLTTSTAGAARNVATAGLSRAAKQAIAMCTDALMLTFCLWLAVALRYGELPKHIERYYWVFPLVPVLTIPYFRYVGLYRAVARYTGSQTLLAGVRAITVTSIVLAMIIYVGGRFEFPRSAPPIFWCVATLYLIGSRQLLHQIALRRGAAAQRQPIIIYGTDEAAIRLAAVLRASGPFKVVAFVDHAPQFHHGELQDIPVLAPTALPMLIAQHNVESVLLTYTQFARADRLRALDILAALPVRVRAVPALGDIVNGLVRIEEFRSIDIADLLGRDMVPAQPELIAARTRGKVVMVTGAAGSIGSELCRQILLQKPRALLMVDQHEHGLYELDREMRQLQRELANAPTEGHEKRTAASTLPTAGVHYPLIANVTDEAHIRQLLERFSVEVIFHAAAYKHVPMVEQNLVAGVFNNVFGTFHVARAAQAAGVAHMVLVSTDKAVRPKSVMGASKRLAELCLKGLAERGAQGVRANAPTNFSMVRFGNVLRSSGSVVPLFEEQIRAGGPVTVTHPEATRYFMSIEEAAQLVIQAAALATPGDIFLLDMGEPVSIDDLARRMIRLAGYQVRDRDHPEGSIEVAYTGLRPGEKLIEELLIEPTAQQTLHPKIRHATEPSSPWRTLEPLLDELEDACRRFDATRVVAWLRKAIPNADLQDSTQQLAVAQEELDEEAALAERETAQRLRQQERSA